MKCWLIAAGTSGSDVSDDWWVGGRAWRRQYGDVYMFSSRAHIAVGDTLVHYAVGSSRDYGSSKFFALSRTVSEVEPSPNERWPWQVAFEYIVRGPLLRYCPSLDEIDTTPTRSHKHLTEEQGVEAERLLTRKLPIFGSLGD